MSAEPVPVRHVEGVTFGFLVLRDMDGKPIAYGDLKQIVKDGNIVIDDLQFRFKDGSFYQEITKFTQHGHFRLLSDQVVQRGSSFKKDSETWIDATTGKVTISTVEKGKNKVVTKHLDLPPDVANGLLFTLAKNIDPAASETNVCMVAAAGSPRLVKVTFYPAQEKTIKTGFITKKAQHYVIKVKVEVAAVMIAKFRCKQPTDLTIWVLKSEAPTFIEFEGVLSEDTPIWRIEMAAADPDPEHHAVPQR